MKGLQLLCHFFLPASKPTIKVWRFQKMPGKTPKQNTAYILIRNCGNTVLSVIKCKVIMVEIDGDIRTLSLLSKDCNILKCTVTGASIHRDKD